MSKAINVYSQPEIENCLSESLPTVFSNLGYTEDHTIIDRKLCAAYFTVTIVCISFILNRKFKWDQVILYQKIILALYCISWIAYELIVYRFRNVSYQGKKNNKTITVKIKFKENKPVADIELIDNTEKHLSAQLKAVEVFTESGFIQLHLLQKWFKEHLEKLMNKKE